MTKNHPTLRKTASTTDLFRDPGPLAGQHDLNRTFTTVHRPRHGVPMEFGGRPARHRFSMADLRNESLLEEHYEPQPPPALFEGHEHRGLARAATTAGRLRPASDYLHPPLPPSRQQRREAREAFRRAQADRIMGREPLIDLGDELGDRVPLLDDAAPQSSPTPPPLPPKIPAVPDKIFESIEERKADPAKYTKPFCDFMTKNPTVFHAVDAVAKDLEAAGYSKLSERDSWDLKRGGKYYVGRNGSSLIAFAIGEAYEPGNGAAILAGHIDALTARLKPIPKLRNKAGYVQLGVAPYAGALNNTWWDRDLGVGGRVLVKDGSKIVSKLVKLNWPIARIPTLAPHFGAAAAGPFNKETQMVPIVGLDNSDINGNEDENWKPSLLGGEGTFVATQPERLVKAISSELGITDYSSIVNWELELFDIQPAQLGGLSKEFIFAGRIDDKLCSWSAIQALIASTSSASHSSSSQIKIVGLFDDEEIGSLLRQGANSNFLPTIIERVVDAFADKSVTTFVSRTYANSFLVSSDVIHAVNPNFLGSYLEQHSPRLNVGLSVSCDPNGHMTTDSVSTSILQRCAEKGGAKLQVFQIRNDSRSGGTVGPMLSAKTGIRAIDAGIPQLSMHSIRATTGSLDPGLGVVAFRAFLDHFESVDAEFRE